MDYKSITAGELATLLDVQRSNISHILNGRNKPGAAFIEKLLVSFPDLNARWLLTGEGEMTEKEVEKIIKDVVQTPTSTKVEELEKVIGEQVKNDDQPKNKKEEKPVSKIVLLYADGTFEDYNKK